MKISKHIHSCLLIEHDGKRILIDPGNYTYEQKALDVSKINTLDYLLITHEHPDHMYIPFVKELVGKFPSLKIISNSSIQKILTQEGLTVSIENDELVRLEPALHDKPLTFPIPQNVAFTIGNKLTHPGDSSTFTKTAEILALPMQTSLVNIVGMLDKAIELKPKAVIPIHDFHWKDSSRLVYYDHAKRILKENGIKFIPLETGRDSEFIEVLPTTKYLS